MSKTRKVLAVLSLIAALALMCVIFYLSNQPAQESNMLSDSVIEQIYSLNGLLVPVLIIRKAAHMCEYALLSFLFSNSFYLLKKKKWQIISFILTFLYACSDEIHQLFIPGRAGMIIDVLIDSSGALLGLAAYFILIKIIIKVRSKKDVRNPSVQSNKTD